MPAINDFKRVKTAVMYGAGNIGRGFIGQLFGESGYETVFIDVADAVVDALNRDRRYPVCVVDNNGKKEVWVENVRAVNGKDRDAAVREIAGCDIMATAVGVNVFRHILPIVAEGLTERAKLRPGSPLNIIICENMVDVDKYMRAEMEKLLPAGIRDNLDAHAGFVEASVGRMVPVMTDEMRGDNVLRVYVEPFCSLPVDKNAFRGEIPAIIGFEPSEPFDFYIRRKLFVHNMGHAAAAYFGAGKGYAFIYEAAGDPEIAAKIRYAMYQSASALAAEYGKPVAEVLVYADDLIERFKNRGTGDTVLRVGRDPLRKLSAGDRLIGAALLCIKRGLPWDGVAAAIKAALKFNDPGDPYAAEMQNSITQTGADGFLLSHCEKDGLDKAGIYAVLAGLHTHD